MCKHCNFINKTFPSVDDMTSEVYWIMTEVFVYLHGSDTCNE